MMQVLPIVIGANVEFSFVLGWMIVLEPIVMRCVPISCALSAIVRDDDSCVGGFGAEGTVEGRFDDDILTLRCLPVPQKAPVDLCQTFSRVVLSF